MDEAQGLYLQISVEKIWLTAVSIAESILTYLVPCASFLFYCMSSWTTSFRASSLNSTSKSSPQKLPFLSRWCRGKESAYQCRRHKRCGFDPWVRKIPWRRKGQPTPVYFPGKSHGQRSLSGCSPWSCKESDMTEHTHTHTNSLDYPF